MAGRYGEFGPSLGYWSVCWGHIMLNEGGLPNVTFWLWPNKKRRGYYIALSTKLKWHRIRVLK